MKNRIAVIVLFAVLLTGCGHKEALPAISSDHERLLEQAQYGSGNLPLSQLALPNHYSDPDFLQTGDFPVVIDADIKVPDVTKVPIAAAVPTKLTQTAADKIMEALLAEENFVSEDGSGAANRLLADGVIEGCMPYEPGRYRVENAHLRIDDNRASFYRDPFGNHDRILYVDEAPEMMIKYIYPSTISREDAIAAADAVIRQMDIKNVACSGVYPVIFLSETVRIDKAHPGNYSYRRNDRGYIIEYAPVAGDIPSHYAYGAERIAPSWDTIKAQRISIGIGTKESGKTNPNLRWFLWDNPENVPEILAEDACLLPFSDIMEIFQTIFPTIDRDYKNLVLLNHVKSAVISEISLREMYIPGDDAEDAGMYVPVWDFCMEISGTRNWEIGSGEAEGDGYTQSKYKKIVMTINAVDGSVVFYP